MTTSDGQTVPFTTPPQGAEGDARKAFLAGHSGCCWRRILREREWAGDPAEKVRAIARYLEGHLLGVE